MYKASVTEYAVAVSEKVFFVRKCFYGEVGSIKVSRRFEDGGGLRTVGTRVHKNRSSDASRNTVCKLKSGKRIFRRQIGGHGDAVRTGHDPFFGHADRFCINTGTAQKIQRAKRLDLFKAVRKQNIDHENHPFGNVIVVLFPCARGV